MTAVYYRPIAQTDRCRPRGALPIAGGWSWFSHLERIERGGAKEVVPAAEVPEEMLERISGKRAPICGLEMDAPRIMGILNATPDSFSDGGLHNTFDGAVARANEMVGQGAEIFDIGGESTRPGADFVDIPEEISRTTPVIEALKASDFELPMSIDTRKSDVAESALGAGARLFNDVTALTYDPRSLDVAAMSGATVCLMHAAGDPKTMQDNPTYDDVLLDVYDYLSERVAVCEAAGIDRSRLIIDAGIGFGKTIDHNLELLRGMSLFHGIGCPILLGVSRKRFIGVIGNAQEAAERAPGSIALALEGLRQGVQILRVHDIAETKQALSLWKAVF